MRHWDVFITDLGFPDIPSAEAYMPNYTEAWQRGTDFYARLSGAGGLDINHEMSTFQADLQAIFNKTP